VLILKQLLPGDDCRTVDAAGLLRRPVENDNAAMDAEPKRKRRWFQFSLRTLLIGVTLLAVACGYVAKEAKTAWQRQSFLDTENPVAFDSSGADEVVLDSTAVRR
jgi:hypothetical protein